MKEEKEDEPRTLFESVHWIYRNSGGTACPYPKRELPHLKVLRDIFGATDEEVARCRRYLISQDEGTDGLLLAVDLSRIAKVFDVWKQRGSPEKYESPLADRPGAPIRRV